MKPSATPDLPHGRLPTIGMRELVAAIHQRRERRRVVAAELANGVQRLAAAVERHLARVAAVRQAIEAQGGDLSAIDQLGAEMIQVQNEVRSAEDAV